MARASVGRSVLFAISCAAALFAMTGCSLAYHPGASHAGAIPPKYRNMRGNIPTVTPMSNAGYPTTR